MQFILTGSATPAGDLTRAFRRVARSTAGVAHHAARPRGLSTEAVSVAGLLRGEHCAANPTGRGVPEAVDALCRGGWTGLDPTYRVRDVIRPWRVISTTSRAPISGRSAA